MGFFTSSFLYPLYLEFSQPHLLATYSIISATSLPPPLIEFYRDFLTLIYELNRFQCKIELSLTFIDWFLLL